MAARLCVAAGLCLMLLVETANAGAAEEEIRHLLEFVEHSGCVFNRNGTGHDAREARSHIERKYDYVKSRVSSAEDFIEYAATRSSLSGDLYTVDCGGVIEPSGDWLRGELNGYRQSRGKPHSKEPAPASN